MEAGRCNGMKSPFRCLLAAARYAAASVMTVLILIVMVKAVKVLLQPVSLSLSVAQGCMFVRRFDKPELLEFQFSVKVVIPRSGARTYFRNITAYMFDKDTPALTSTPGPDSVIFFHLDDVMVPPQQQVVSEVMQSSRLGRDYVALSFFDLLYNRPHNDIVSDMTMRLDSNVSQVTSTSTYNRATTYICWPLVVGLAPDAFAFHLNGIVLEDVFCREEQGKHLI